VKNVKVAGDAASFVLSLEHEVKVLKELN